MLLNPLPSPTQSTAGERREKKLLAPILVTPTKPLTPSHLKAFLWFDVLYKATSLIHDVTYLYNRTTYDIAYQTLAFWVDLDRQDPGQDFTLCSEVSIGERYVDFHRRLRSREAAVCPATLAEYRRRVEEEGWIHPVSRRILEIWTGYYDLLGLDRPDLTTSTPLAVSVEEALERLAQADVLLDGRRMGGPVYLDLTDQGIPLRQIVDEHGQDNYVLSTLRMLLPVAADYESMALLCDEELQLDYLLIERVLRRLGCPAHRLSLGRVPLDGEVRSSRGGGWQSYTFDKIIERFAPHDDLDTFRLGMRLYFIAGLGSSAKQSFRFDLLEPFMQRAARLLVQHPPRAAEVNDEQKALLRRFSESWNGYVDPYQLTSALLSRKRPIEPAGVLPKVYL